MSLETLTLPRAQQDDRGSSEADGRANHVPAVRALAFDGRKERFAGDPEADRLLTREYRAPFVVPEAP